MVPDERTNDYFLGNSPLLVLCVVIAYYYFVTDYGPKLMKNRPAFNIDWLLIVYNILQIIINAYICSKVSSTLKMKQFEITTFQVTLVLHLLNLTCHEVDYSDSYLGRLAVHLGWIYFMNKILDLADTVSVSSKTEEKSLPRQ